MARFHLILFTALCCMSTSADAGWLTDKLKEAAEEIGVNVPDQESPEADGGASKGEEQSAASEDPRDSSARQPYESAGPEVGADGRESAGGESRRPMRTDLHFSADMLMVDPESSGKESRGKMYVDGERMRMEMTDPETGQPVIYIMDGKAQRFLLLMPAEKTLMEMPMSSTEGEEDWRAALSAEPCDGYRTAEEVGRTTHDGRGAVEWRCEDPEDADDAFNLSLWFDAKLHIPVRSEDSEGNRFELQNLKEGAQSASLFAVPGGYSRMNLFGGVSGGPESSNPYAPKVEPVPGSEGSLGAMILANTVVPDAAAVGIPAYPGARVLQAQNKPVIEGGTNHIVVLLTADPEDKVLGFYRRELRGWKEDKLMGMTPVFHQGAELPDPFTAEGQSVPNVAVETIIESMQFEVMPQAKTKVTIGYQPKM